MSARALEQGQKLLLSSYSVLSKHVLLFQDSRASGSKYRPAHTCRWVGTAGESLSKEFHCTTYVYYIVMWHHNDQSRGSTTCTVFPLIHFPLIQYQIYHCIHTYTLTSSLFRKALALLFDPPEPATALLSAFTVPPADPGPLDEAVLIPTVVPLVTIIPVGGGVPGTELLPDEDITRGFWSRNKRDCWSPIGSITPTVDGVVLPVPWIWVYEVGEDIERCTTTGGNLCCCCWEGKRKKLERKGTINFMRSWNALQ